MNELTKPDENNNHLYSEIQNILDKAREHAYTAVNSAMVTAIGLLAKLFWNTNKRELFEVNTARVF